MLSYLKLLSQKSRRFELIFKNCLKNKALVFDNKAFDHLLIKSGFQFSEIQKNLLFLQSYKEDSVIEEEDIVNAIPKTLQDNIFDLTQFILTKRWTRRAI